MDLKKEVKDFIDNPEKLMQYKKKAFKNEKNTNEIDDLIHQAIIKQKAAQREVQVDEMKVI